MTRAGIYIRKSKLAQRELDGLVIALLGRIGRNRKEIVDGIREFLAKRHGEVPKRKQRLEKQLQQAISASQKILSAYEEGVISLDQLKARNEEHKTRINELRKGIIEIDVELARQGLDLDLATLEKRLSRFQADLSRMDAQGLRALVDPLVSKARLFNEKVELTFSFPVEGEHTHVYPLPGKPQGDLRPHSSTDQSTSLLSLGSRFDSWWGHIPVEVIASARSQVAGARARAF